MFSFITVEPQQYNSIKDLKKDMVEFEDYTIPIAEIKEIISKETEDLDVDGNPIVLLELITVDGTFKFYETGIKEFCKALKYSFSNFNVLDEVNIIDDLNYRINVLRSSDLEITFRTEKHVPHSISHCYAYKTDKPLGSPLFNTDVLQLIEDNPEIFDDNQLVSILMDENNLCITYKYQYNAINIDHDDPDFNDVFVRGISIHNNEMAGKGGLRIGSAFITNDNGHVFFDRNEATMRRSIELPYVSTLEAAKAHLALLKPENDAGLDLPASYVRMRKEFKTTTQNVGYLYRNIKGISKKEKQLIFQDFLVHIQDEPTDEILPTATLEERGLTLWHIFIAASKVSNMILNKDKLSVGNFINTALFSGDLLDENNLIYGNYL